MKRTPAIQKLKWDTDFFGFPVARLSRPLLSRGTVDAVMKFCRAQKIKCLYYRAASDDLASVELAEKSGFHFSCFRVSYELNWQGSNQGQPLNEKKFILRLVRPDDLRKLQAMSKNLYKGSRFYFDSRFPKKLADKFFSHWVTNFATSKRKSEGVYILVDRNKIAGYIAYELVRGGVHLVLVGVNREYQGQGVGKVLLAKFIKAITDRGITKFIVTTEGQNIASQRLYQGTGFKIINSEIDYHKWF